VIGDDGDIDSISPLSSPSAAATKESSSISTLLLLLLLLLAFSSPPFPSLSSLTDSELSTLEDEELTDDSGCPSPELEILTVGETDVDEEGDSVDESGGSFSTDDVGSTGLLLLGSSGVETLGVDLVEVDEERSDPVTVAIKSPAVETTRSKRYLESINY